MDAAVSLSLHISEKNKSLDKDMLITFDSEAEIFRVQDSLSYRIDQMKRF